MLTSAAAPLFLDSFTSEISTLKHNTIVLYNENKEIKQILSDVRNYRCEHTEVVRFLKGTVCQLMEQQDLFKNSFTAIEKQVKQLRQENCQIKSKYDILQLRLKNLQSNQEQLPTTRSICQSPTYETHLRQLSKEDALDFQLSPRLENIIHKGTRDRLENLMKDLEDVFKKGEVQSTKAEDRKEEKEEDWLSPSELNTSQTHSERSQLTCLTHQVGDINFENLGLYGGQQYFLIDQMEMLNPSQGSPKNFGDDRSVDSAMFSKAVSFGEASPKERPQRGGAVVTPAQKAKTSRPEYTEKTLSIFSHEKSGSGAGMIKTKTNPRTMSGGIPNASVVKVEKKEVEINDNMINGNRIPPIKINPIDAPRSIYASPKMQIQDTQNMTAPSTITQIGSEIFSSYLGNDDNWAPTPKQVGVNTPILEKSCTFGEQGSGFGVATANLKKEIYLKEENMLMEVLDKRGEQVVQRGNINMYAPQSQQEIFGVISNHPNPQDKVYFFPQKGEDGGDKDILERINTIDTSILSTNSETSSVTNSVRGTKRLKLVRKNMKSKGGEGSQHESISSNFA